MLSASNTMSCCGFIPCWSMGCNGGHPGLAWWWLVHHGVVTGGLYGDSETCWPYEIDPATKSAKTPSCKRECTNKAYKNPFTKDVHEGKRAYMLHGREAIKENLYKFGPVTAMFLVMSDFMSYKGGIYSPTAGSTPMGGHAIKIVGWGKEKDVDFWIVQNSWNET